MLFTAVFLALVRQGLTSKWKTESYVVLGYLHQFTDTMQVSVLWFAFIFGCQPGGRYNTDHFQGQKGWRWKTTKRRKEEERKIHQAFLVAMISRSLKMTGKDMESKCVGWGRAGNQDVFSHWEGDSCCGRESPIFCLEISPMTRDGQHIPAEDPHAGQ